MSHTLDITDGTTTVTLTSGNMYLSSYVPQSSQRDELLRETAIIGFTGTLSTIRSNVQSLNRLFAQAANYWKTYQGPKVYVEFDPGASGTVYRSPLYGGKIDLNEEILGGQWAAANFELMLEWSRLPYWEGPVTVLALTNMHGTNTTSGLQVDNVNDSSGNNFVFINDSDVIGDLPAPIKVEMYNSYSSADPCDEVYMFHNVYSNPATITHVLEGESATGSYVSTAAEGTPGSSNDQYAVIAWSTTNEIKVATLALSSAQLTSSNGGRFAVLVRWNAAFPYTDMWLRLKREGSSGILWTGDLLTIPNAREVHLLDTLRLGKVNQTGLTSENLTLYGKRTDAGTHTLNLDYLMLAPIHGDGGWKHFLAQDAGVAYQHYFYYDDIERQVYALDGSSQKHYEWSEYGGPILLEPNADQKLYFVTCDNNGLAKVEQTWTVRVWFRPRRNSL